MVSHTCLVAAELLIVMWLRSNQLPVSFSFKFLTFALNGGRMAVVLIQHAHSYYWAIKVSICPGLVVL